MEKYNIKFFEGEIPKYIQITKHIKKLIDNNLVEDGEKLPSIRKLGGFLEVNNITIVSAYNKLEQEGYAVQKVGSGTFAKRREVNKNFKREYSETLKKVSGENLSNYIDFTGESACSDLFPVKEFKSVLNEVLDRDGASALMYQEALGYEGLRESIDKFFWNGQKGIENILIVSGAQQGIDIVSKAILNVNDSVIVEKPTYSGALSVFKSRRANIFEVSMKNDGIDLIEFEKIVKKNKIKCFYTMSYFQNPTCMSLSTQKKKELLNMAEIYNFYIIEDDYLSELIYDDNMKYNSLKSMDIYDRVIYIKSFSKVFLPGIRLGYLIAPLKLKETIQNSKVNTDIATSSLMQRALDLYIKNGYWKYYIQKINSTYKIKYDFMEKSIGSILSEYVEFISPGGGLNFYLKLKDTEKLDCMKLFYRCKERKVLITPGTIFYKNPIEGKDYFRISFAHASEEEIREGLAIIKDIIVNL